MPQTMAAEHLKVMREAQHEQCSVCREWETLRVASATELWCCACGAVCKLVLDGRTVVEQWPVAK